MKQLPLIRPRRRTPGIKLGRPVSTHCGSRQKRNLFKGRHPLHITLRLRERLPNLRSRRGAQLIKHAILGAQSKGLRVVHFSILSNHLHMIVEAQNPQLLYVAMRSFSTRFALGLRRWADQFVIDNLTASGLGLFRGRYDVQVLDRPLKLKNALQYVLLNASKHFKRSPYIDEFGSACCFSYWKQLGLREMKLSRRLRALQNHLEEWLSPPQTWLLTTGWMQTSL